MRLAFPWALLLILPVLKIVVDRFRHKRGSALKFSTLATFEKMPRTMRQKFVPLLFWMKVLALLLLIVALSRPQRKDLTQGIPTEGIAIELAVDISSSMDMQMPFKDTTLSRSEITKQVVGQFVADRPDDLIGLITFARYADTICPLTLSHDSLLYFIERLGTELRPNEDGTAFGDALALAAARLKTTENRYGKEEGYSIQSRVIILLTDGSNNCGRHLPMEGAALAKHWGIRIHTVSITNPPKKKTIQTPEGPVDVEEELPMQERILKEIAKTTGGIYRRAVDEASLRDVYAEINAMETSKFKMKRYQVFIDIFQPFAIGGLVLLLTHSLLSCTWLRRIP